MILDKQAILSDNQAITASAASENTIDFGFPGTPVYANQIKPNAGCGAKVPLLIQITEDFVGATSLDVELQTSNDVAFTTPTTLYKHSFAAADLVAGARAPLPVFPYGTTQQYLRAYYTVGGTATAGRITVGVSGGNDETEPYQ